VDWLSLEVGSLATTDRANTSFIVSTALRRGPALLVRYPANCSAPSHVTGVGEDESVLVAAEKTLSSASTHWRAAAMTIDLRDAYRPRHRARRGPHPARPKSVKWPRASLSKRLIRHQQRTGRCTRCPRLHPSRLHRGVQRRRAGVGVPVPRLVVCRRRHGAPRTRQPPAGPTRRLRLTPRLRRAGSPAEFGSSDATQDAAVAFR
jgi:hypothetical protein